MIETFVRFEQPVFQRFQHGLWWELCCMGHYRSKTQNKYRQSRQHLSDTGCTGFFNAAFANTEHPRA